MVPDPNNKMDELLKAYARKRREQAGEPPGLHPATRNLLQAEITKLAPKKSRAAGSGLGWLSVLWPRVAFALSVFVLLGIGVWVWFKPSPSGKTFSQLDLQKDRQPAPANSQNDQNISEKLGRSVVQQSDRGERLIESAETLSGEPKATASLKDEHAAVRPELAQVSDRDGTATEKKAETSTKGSIDAPEALQRRYGLSRENTAAPRPTSAPVRPPAINTPSGEKEAVTTSLETLAKRESNLVAKTVTLRAQPAPTSSDTKTITGPAQGVSGPALATQSSEASVRSRMVNQLTIDAADAYKSEGYAFNYRDGATGAKPVTELREDLALLKSDSTAKAAAARNPPPTILSSFDVEQNGQRLRIIEADGSVYNVRFLSATARGGSRVEQQARQQSPQEQTRQKIPLRRVSADEARLGGAATVPVQNFSFEAMGTNRSVNQVVTINGVWAVDNSQPQQEASTQPTQASATAATVGSARFFSQPSGTPAQNMGPAGAKQLQQILPDGNVLPTRIVGQARIGTNQVDLNAVRVTP